MSLDTAQVWMASETNAYARIEGMPERPMQEAMTNDLLVVAAQLIEAACRAPDGGGEAGRGHIGPSVTHGF
jgi:hypothetical protein